MRPFSCYDAAFLLEQSEDSDVCFASPAHYLYNVKLLDAPPAPAVFLMLDVLVHLEASNANLRFSTSMLTAVIICWISAGCLKPVLEG